MRVVHVFWSLTYGGIETMLINIANAQANEGAEVHIIIIKDMYKEDLVRALDKSVALHLLHCKNKPKGIGFIFKLNRLLVTLKPDAIHLHGSRLYTFLWHKCLRRVASVTLHDLPKGTLRRGGIMGFFFPFIFKSGNVYCIDKAPRVFSISKAVKEELWNRYGVKSEIVPNGILTNNFSVRKNRYPSEAMRIVMVSRLEHYKKGQDLLIRAVMKLKCPVKVDFIGVGSSREYLENLVKELHAEEVVFFLGSKPQSYIAEHLADYDLFVQPSRWEGFGLTVAEAMAAKVPVLVSTGQGPAEVTCGDRYGWLFENGNENDLVSQITKIFDCYDEAIEKSDRALKYVRDTYDVSVTAKKYLELYKV